MVEGGREAGYDGRSSGIAEAVGQEARAVTGCFRTTNLGAPSAIGKRLEAALGFVTPPSNLPSPYPLELPGVVGQ